MAKGKKNIVVEADNKTTLRKRKRVTRFDFVSSSNHGNDSERIVKFLNGLKDIDLSNSDDSAEQFEILCINTIGYVQPLARQILFNALIDKNEK